MAGVIFQYPCREGSTGLELEAVRHQYSRVTPSYGCNLVIAVLQARDEASACASRETNAAVKIQATFRMHLQATAFRDVRHKTCTIQRVFRGYSTRKRLQNERNTTERLAYLTAVFEMFATRIQACFRGYYSRKIRFNYYAQQAYIDRVTTRALIVLEDAHHTRIEQDKLRSAESQRMQALNYARRTAELHHTISTCAIPSVYLRPSVSLERLAHNAQAALGGGGCDGTGTATIGDGALSGYELAQAAVFTAGEKLEEDIRENSRAARHNRVTLGKSGVSPGASPRSVATTAAPSIKTAEKKSTATTASSQSPRPPALDGNLRRQKVSARLASGNESSTTSAVPWESASARPPQRPLVEKALQHKSDTLSGATSAAGTAVAVSDPSNTASKSVSSFHRKFTVKRHDCIEYNASYQGVGTQNRTAAVTFPGPLSMEKERAAQEHSVNQKVIQSIHGNAVFKVPAGRGKRK